MSPRGFIRSVGAVAVLALLTSCGQAQETAVTAVAGDFVEAITAGDGARACDLLSVATRAELEQSTGKPCDRAVLEEDVQGGTPRSVSVFETTAQVKYEDQALFLSRFSSGWLVTAAACTPVRDRPYDCSIQGG